MLRTALRRTKEAMLTKHLRVLTAAKATDPTIHSKEDYKGYRTKNMTFGASMAALLAGMTHVAMADDSKDEGPENPLKKMVREEFQIPAMIADREAAK